MVKRILFPLFSVFLGYQSSQMMTWLLLVDPQAFSWMEAFLIAFVLSLFVTGVFAFLGFAFPTHKILPSSYYQVNKGSRLNAICKVMGMKYFKFLLLYFFWGRGTNRKRYFDGTREGLDDFIYETKQSEFGHLGALIVIGVLSLQLLNYGYFVSFVVICLINVIGNLYPVLLQRSHRWRVQKMIKN